MGYYKPEDNLYWIGDHIGELIEKGHIEISLEDYKNSTGLTELSLIEIL